MSLLALLRLGLVGFVLAWLVGPAALRSAVPIWLVFVLALGLELHFFVGAVRPAPARSPDRGPQAVDRERYGYADGDDDEDWEEDDWEDEEDEDEWEPVPRRRPVLRLASGIAVIAALALVLWVVESRTGWDALDADDRAAATTRFSNEAARIAGKPVSIRCDESGAHVGVVQHADGVAAVGGELAYLTPERCLDLYRLAFEGGGASSRTARAIAVLAHEAWHLRGVRDEGATECFALQSGVELGRRLGLSEGTAARLMRQQLAENALRGHGTPAYLVGPECRDGGRLDLDRGSSRFP